MTVPADYAVPIPDSLVDTEAAPLLYAGAIGYRALQLTEISHGDPLGLMGFGGSAHLVLQVVKHFYPDSPVFVFTRDDEVQGFAVQLGADWAGNLDQLRPKPLRSIIDTTPAWKPIVESMKKLAPGGRLVINAIRKEDSDKSALLDLSYHDHLWMEREIKSVANLTKDDIATFIPLAAKIPLRPEVTVYPLEQANDALQNLRKALSRTQTFSPLGDRLFCYRPKMLRTSMRCLSNAACHRFSLMTSESGSSSDCIIEHVQIEACAIPQPA